MSRLIVDWVAAMPIEASRARISSWLAEPLPRDEREDRLLPLRLRGAVRAGHAGTPAVASAAPSASAARSTSASVVVSGGDIRTTVGPGDRGEHAVLEHPQHDRVRVGGVPSAAGASSKPHRHPRPRISAIAPAGAGRDDRRP